MNINCDNTSNGSIRHVATELDSLRCIPAHEHGREFPAACRDMIYSLPGNALCVDCGSPGPEWASVTYGVLLCVQCCGRHRSYGVRTSFVRSIAMDSWKHSQVLAMLEGGNEQLRGFFKRHRMDNGNDVSAGITSQRYRTKAALFYSTHLTQHVDAVSSSGSYKGREAVRQKQTMTTTTTPSRCSTEASSRQTLKSPLQSARGC